MHAIMIQFHSDLTGENLMGDLSPSWMGQVLGTPGLVMKTFLGSTPNDFGGFYLFATEEAAAAYLAGETWQAITSHPAVSDVDVRHFHVVDEPSVVCGTPVELNRPPLRSPE